ncbi:LOW QUALITY PROTEIN: G-protein coupled receptor family C group 6 member A-like [Fundulus heteroclitus]|uniref:LOW QUALITY PROTEIN: G-protein coupled receptor family C group 6 member A-like n=1 Tax=Fundulus heteroclitus TaxID=8078 RepID=UPI00165AB49A|nr:LOW QUALITY PROTEIN: G-protein coupled receptor family C group 6 member A-like [Fundulus heteroclitus]
MRRNFLEPPHTARAEYTARTSFLPLSTMFLLKLLVTLMSVFHSSSKNNYLHVYSPGDIMIGGLFPIHQQRNTTKDSGPISCDEFDIQTLLRTQVMIYAIQEINQRSPRLLPNFTLGYDIYDTCGDVSLAIRAALQLLKNQSDPQMCLIPSSIESSLPEPETKVVIGESSSEVSIAVARIFALPSVTQISYASTSELLSKKYKFPTFLRTVSSDRYQTKAICELVKNFSWQSVAIVGSDDEYGKYGTDSLKKLFGENNICVEFVEILPGDFSEKPTTAGDLIEKINASTAEAIIMFTKDSNVRIVLEGVIKKKLNRTWIASDSWSTSPDIFKIEGIDRIGPVFGFIYRQNDVPGFENYICSEFNGTTKAFLSHYQLSQINFEDDTECNCKNKTSSCLHCYTDRGESFNIYLAVQVIAEGLRSLLRCDNGSCERTDFTAVQLFEEIRNVSITVNNTNIQFDTSGDPSLGYDVMFWNQSESKGGIDIRKIGEYWPNENITFHEDVSQWRKTETVTVFNCSKKCQPGERLNLKNEKCCYECITCSYEEYSFGNGTKCIKCNEKQYAPENQRDTCVNKTEEFLEWTDPFSIILSIMAVFAIVATVFSAIIIRINRGTPIVKAIGGCLCFVELASLLLGFSLTFTFIGKPTSNSCLGIPLFGISFCLCVSCILANLIQIMQGFSFDPRVCSRIKKLNHPVAIVVIISGVQVAVSLAWLIDYPPTPIEAPNNITILYQCNIYKDPPKFFVATIVYDSFWGFVCFFFAFKGRQLPDIYKNASLITVSMVLFLIIWIVFVPIFISLEGKYKPAISSAAVLISCFSILACHLAPKCYIMLFRRELNNQNAISEYIRKHYERMEISVISS